MIAEPYICIDGRTVGEICWFDDEKQQAVNADIQSGNKFDGESEWQRYADFEREKMKELGYTEEDAVGSWFPLAGTGFVMVIDKQIYDSDDLISYSSADYDLDTEFSRLLKRAEFLKAVCEKQGVEWLPEIRNVVGSKLEEENYGECFDCGNLPCSCPMRMQLDRDLVRHFYTKQEIDERVSSVLELIENVPVRSNDIELPVKVVSKAFAAWVAMIRSHFLR